MPNQFSNFTRSLKELGEVQVTGWDFMELLNKDIKDLEIGRSLRKLGNTKVMEWDFRTAVPAVREFAHQEVDLADWVRRAASYKVMEWDFRSGTPEPGTTGGKRKPDRSSEVPGGDETEAAIRRLKNFLQFVTVNLIDDAELAQIMIERVAPGVVRFKLVVTEKDAREIVGRSGHTAAAIRNLLKAAAEAQGIQALLEIRTPGA